MTKEVCVISHKTDHSYDYENMERFLQPSDWCLISDDEYYLLDSYLIRKNSQRTNSVKYVLLVKETAKQDFIQKAITEYLELAKQAADLEAQKKAKAESVKQQKLLKKKAKDEEAELKLLEELQKKYSAEDVKSKA